MQPEPQSSAAQPPDDVMAWLRETYDDEGVAIWLRQWRASDRDDREHMEWYSRIDAMGT